MTEKEWEELEEVCGETEKRAQIARWKAEAAFFGKYGMEGPRHLDRLWLLFGGITLGTGIGMLLIKWGLVAL